MNFLTLLLRLLVKSLWAREWKGLIEKLGFAHMAFYTSDKERFPQVLISALVVAEDHRFYLHRGVDLPAIVRALWYSCCRGRLIGGSTIEQQLVRTLTGRKERTVARKLKEMAMAFCVGQSVPKSDLPGMYLSIAYFGWRMNGIHQACARLGVDMVSMTPRQAAELVARLKYPEPSNPTTTRFSQIHSRRDYILARLYSLSIAKPLRITRLTEGETVSLNQYR